MLHRNVSYTNNKSDLKLYIINVSYYNDEYIKVKASLINKFNDIIYETRNYKLYRNNINNWYVLDWEIR